jgi:transposase-like protein
MEDAMAEGKFGPGRGFGEGLFTDRGESVRTLVEEVVQALIGTEADEHFGVPWNAKGLPRPNGYRNGLKGRELRTRMGTLKLRLPQARNGSFFPSCLERWQTSEQALAATLGEMVIKGVSTRKVAQLAEEMLGVEVSASTVSNLLKAIEPKVNAFRERPLGSYRYLLVDARFDKVRDNHRVTSRAFLWAAGVTPEGQREVLGWLDWSSETGRAWAELFRQLKGRGLTGVELVVSDAHEGLVRASEEAFPGAMWQQCQTHFMRRALDLARDVDKGALCDDLRMILQASNRERAEEEKALLEKHWGKKYPKLLGYLEDHFDSVLAVLNVPAGHRKRLRTTNHVERVNQELKRRGRTVRIWPNPASRDRLYGALLMEQHERWVGITWLKQEGV